MAEFLPALGPFLTTAPLCSPPGGLPPARSVTCKGSCLLDLQPSDVEIECPAGKQRERHRHGCINLDNLVYKLYSQGKAGVLLPCVP